MVDMPSTAKSDGVWIDNVENCSQLGDEDFCKICTKLVEDDDRALQCEQCTSWFHQSCLQMSDDKFTSLENSDAPWGCLNCIDGNGKEEQGVASDAVVSMVEFKALKKMVKDELELMAGKISSLQQTKDGASDIYARYEAVVMENNQLRAELRALKSAANTAQKTQIEATVDDSSSTMKGNPSKGTSVLPKRPHHTETQPRRKQGGVYTQENPESNAVLSWRNREEQQGRKQEHSRRRGKKFGIFGDSMLSRLRRNVMSDDIENIFVCLLYTSPSPRDRSLSRMPSSA